MILLRDGAVVTLLSVLSCCQAAAANHSFCHFTQEDSRWWLACPGSQLQRTLSIGVNHVENADVNISFGAEQYPNGTFGPPRYSTILNTSVCPWFYDSYDKSLNTSVFMRSTLARYGNSSAWAAAVASDLRSWGFKKK